MAFLLGTFYAAMAAAGYVIELVFGGLGLVPSRASATIPDEGISWNYTTWLNIVFLILAAVLALRFFRTGGGAMLKMMGGAPEPEGDDEPGRAHRAKHPHTKHPHAKHPHTKHPHTTRSHAKHPHTTRSHGPDAPGTAGGRGGSGHHHQG
jgi:uncharacterized protein